jgi:diguanylate cyclase (GGDEF)-like protein
MTAELQNVLSTGVNFAVAGDLLRALVPRAQYFSFYDPTAACLWSSTGSDDFEVDNDVAELTREAIAVPMTDPAVLHRALPSGRSALLLFVQGRERQRIGVLAVVFAGSYAGPAPSGAGKLENVLLQAAEILGEGLRLEQQVQTERSRAVEAEQELRLVYQVDEKIHGTSRRHASLAELVGQSGRFLGIAYSVLLLPSKKIRISATHSSWKGVNRKVLDRYLMGTLFPRMQGTIAPVIFEVPAVPGSDSVADHGYQTMVCPVTDRMGKVEGILAQLGRVNNEPFRLSHTRFMSHIVRKAEYVIEQSFDAMTGLTNRDGFEAQLRESMEALSGDEDAHQIIYFDLDNVQLMNDTFGHQAGDEVITRFARILEQHLPNNAVATRLTGNDFAVLLTHSTLDDALQLTATVREGSKSLRYLEGDKSLQVTASIGIATFDRRTAEGDALTAARIACDSAKDHGRDRVEVYDQDDQSIVRRYDDMNLVANIQKMLDGDGFELLAQPIVSLQKKRESVRFEILLRMKDSDGNSISSKSFFSAAERYQLMPQIDRWVISTTLRKLARYSAVLQDSDAAFAVNLSGQSLGDDALLRFVSQEIDSSGLPAKLVSFEVTESAAVSNHARAQAFIDALRKRGCKFSLDDFGAGLSSFAYLKTFQVDTLKIDGSFIKDIAQNRISESMVAAITQVAKVMQLETVAEYVESDEIRTFVTRLGVDYAQGHAVGRPVPLDQVLNNLAEAGKQALAGCLSTPC